MTKLKLTIKYLVLCGMLFALLSTSMQNSAAQEALPEGPLYQVQEGDNLWQIALQFNVSIDELATVNGISPSAGLAVGDVLVIPGLPGVNGFLTSREVAFGETLNSLSLQYRTKVADLALLNRIVSPAQVYRGASLILTENLSENASETAGEHRSTLRAGTSPLEMGLVEGINPWLISERNNIHSFWSVQAGETLLIPGDQQTGGLAGPLALPDVISAIQLRPDPIEQGSTVVLAVESREPIQLQGSFADQQFPFYQQDSTYYALQGVQGLLPAGFYPLAISGELSDGEKFGFSQWVFVRDAGFPYDPPLTVDPSTVDPAVTGPENEQIFALVSGGNSERYWSDRLVAPVAPVFSDCFPSRYGNRRSYNGGEYSAFHTGLDFCGQTGDDIYAPAEGVVVFSGPLTVRGNTTVIDHGWGVFTVYMHQSEILVETNDQVSTGQLIGRVGGTGRVTGPHLHWEVWAGGIQVDPIYWLQETFP